MGSIICIYSSKGSPLIEFPAVFTQHLPKTANGDGCLKEPLKAGTDPINNHLLKKLAFQELDERRF
jgi:hypothetical protein